MPGECSICLSPFKDPASPPCGHIFCKECIYDCVNSQPAGTKAYCPVCRKEFNIVLPDLQLLPGKYHEYVLPSLRRVYFDEQPSEEVESLKTQLAMAQSSQHAAEQKIRQLQQQVEHMRNAATQAYQQEAQAKDQVRAQEAMVNNWAAAHNRLNGSYKQLEAKHQKLESEHNSMKERCGQLLQRLGLTRPAPTLPSPIDRQPLPQSPGYLQNPQYFQLPLHPDGAGVSSEGYPTYSREYPPPPTPLQPSMSSNTLAQMSMSPIHTTGVKRNSQVAFDDQQPYSPTMHPQKRPCMPGPS